ncbi:filamentous hemagglutinin N-terminal domain-containing protein [Helicobacter pullorum]|uniref:filamentous hemagglutinin N-terminal domain-containing protein n=1 Tax=Helicobacter pullorum TaxID=35818 RepID=UPI001478A8B2
MALPSGGKFTIGSGSITTINGNTMNITGNNKNHVIAWGGGFNINKGEVVNFDTSHKNPASFLNLDYSNQASKILGTLNGGKHNIYLVNPSGVLVGKEASINANKFIASTSPIDQKDLDLFNNQNTLVESFSPVFKPNKGNIVNLGTIKANNGITLIGNEVVFAESAKLINQNGNTQNNSITLIGNELDMRAQYIKGKVITSIEDKASIQISTTNLYGYENFNIETQNYNGITSAISIKDFKGIATIGKEKGNNAESLRDWYYFAKGWNEGKNQIRDLIDDFVLLSDIDFGKNEKISLIDGTQLSFSGNYADFNGDNDYSDSMVVGGVSGYFSTTHPNYVSNAFAANFIGNGHTISNVDIDIDAKYTTGDLSNITFAGIFGQTSGGTISNLSVDNVEITATAIDTTINHALSTYIGGFVGYSDNSTFSNIALENIHDLKGGVIGGFAGTAGDYSNFSNITLNNVGSLTGGDVGGFIGDLDYYRSDYNTFSNISLEKIHDLTGSGSVGGFVGNANMSYHVFSNITLNDIDNLTGSMIGGFVSGQSSGSFTNITLNNVHGLKGEFGGGFAMQISEGSTVSNIVLNDISIETSGEVGGFAWDFVTSTASNVVLNGVNIKVNGTGNISWTGGFAGRVGSAIFSNIVLNDVNIAITGGFPSWLGGFAGFSPGQNTFHNIILNGIGDLSAYLSDSNGKDYGGVGGFIGWIETINGADNFSNIYLYFDSDSVITSTGNSNKYIGKFYGNLLDEGTNEKNDPLFESTFSNVHIYYKDGSLANASSDSNDYNSNGGKINLHTYTDSTQGIKDFQTAITGNNIFENVELKDYEGNSITFDPTYNQIIKDPNDSKEYFKINIDDTTGYYSFINTDKLQQDLDSLVGSNNPNDPSNPGGGAGSDSSNPNDSIQIPTLDSTLVTNNYIPIAEDYNKGILDSILGENNLIFDLLGEDDLESIRQSLDFLVSFLDGENDIKELFGDYYKVNDNIYGALNQDLTINLKFSNFIEALKQNKDINLAFLKDYRDKLNTYNQNKELYQSGGLPPLEQESLKKLLEEQYNELLNLEQIAKTNLESLQGLIKDSFKMDTNYTIFAKESLSPLNFTINIGSLDNFEDTQGNGDNNNRFTPPNEVQKIADLASKEAILILPAQEKQEAIVEDGKERGRLCIVSDNAKTNNPCMAITY